MLASQVINAVWTMATLTTERDRMLTNRTQNKHSFSSNKSVFLNCEKYFQIVTAFSKAQNMQTCFLCFSYFSSFSYCTFMCIPARCVIRGGVSTHETAALFRQANRQHMRMEVTQGKWKGKRGRT